jgi:NAD kinase
MKSFDMLISIGGDGTILRAATLMRFWNSYIGINREDWVLATSKKTSMNFYKLLLKKIYAF